VLDATTGAHVADLPIGGVVDAIALDLEHQRAFVGCGEGVVTVVSWTDATHYQVTATIKTQRGAKTLVYDAKTGCLFLSVAQYVAAPAPTDAQPEPKTGYRTRHFWPAGAQALKFSPDEKLELVHQGPSARVLHRAGRPAGSAGPGWSAHVDRRSRHTRRQALGINTAWIMTQTRNGDRSMAMPLLDINYGVGAHLQLKYEAPWLVTRASGEKTKSGLGDSEIGVKWRFLDEENNRVDVSTYPQFSFNNLTSSRRRGLVEEGSSFLLPFEFHGKAGGLEWNAEIGRGISDAGKRMSGSMASPSDGS